MTQPVPVTVASTDLDALLMSAPDAPVEVRERVHAAIVDARRQPLADPSVVDVGGDLE